MCIGGSGVGGAGKGWKVVGGACFTSDFHHARLTRDSFPICK